MTHALQSYSEGRWQDGPGEQQPGSRQDREGER